MNEFEKSGPAAAGKCPFGNGQAEKVSLADTLREQTKEQHTRTERHPFEGRLIGGKITKTEYAAYLRQIRHVLRALESALQSRSKEPAFAALIRPYHFYSANTEADLAALGEPVEGRLLPGTAEFVGLIARGAADVRPWLLGVWYVLEGSTNGGRYIAKALTKALGLAPGVAVSAFDPHGEAQRERWLAWREGIDGLVLTEEVRQSIVDGAGQTFDVMYDLLEDLENSVTSPKVETVVFAAAPTEAAGA